MTWNEIFENIYALIRGSAFYKVPEILKKSQGNVYPPKEMILRAFELTPFENVKVVILGQDPYHGRGQAHGLSFSVPIGIKPPPSLENIFKELESDMGIPRPNHGNLEKWAKQGVLLLNTILTVEESKPLSHANIGWEMFTYSIITELIRKENPVVFMLWGKKAQITNSGLSWSELIKKTFPHHLVLEAAHPSPYSANKGFFGCKHFSKANEFLVKNGREAVDWNLL